MWQVIGMDRYFWFCYQTGKQPPRNVELFCWFSYDCTLKSWILISSDPANFKNKLRLALIETWKLKLSWTTWTWWKIAKITNTSTLVEFLTNYIGHWSFFFGNWCSSRIKLSSTWIDVKVVFRHDIRQVSENALGVPGVPWHTQILADRLTLFQPGGTDYDLPTTLLAIEFLKEHKCA